MLYCSETELSLHGIDYRIQKTRAIHIFSVRKANRGIYPLLTEIRRADAVAEFLEQVNASHHSS